MSLMLKTPLNTAGWHCDDCGTETIWTMAMLESPYTPRDYRGWLLTKHEAKCPVGIKQIEDQTWHHISIGFGL